MTLVANPSHLEAVNPVVEGKTFARQFYTKDVEKKKAVSGIVVLLISDLLCRIFDPNAPTVLVHGDASFAGQGVVYETLEMTTVKQYTTGGTIHIVINNQIGFTTQLDVRAGMYCTDVAKSVSAPIFHVNGDDVDAVVRVCRLAADYRNEFGQDVVIDIVCYRRYGHNEVDQPKFTQPVMYSRIEKHPSTLDIYSKRVRPLISFFDLVFRFFIFDFGFSLS